MENVEDDEGENREPGPNHNLGGLAGTDGCFMGVSWASSLVLPH